MRRLIREWRIQRWEVVDNSMISEEELFRVVGPGWKTYEIQKKKENIQGKAEGKPVFSMILLLIVVLGCVFANLVANQILQDFISGIWIHRLEGNLFWTDSLGRDIYPWSGMEDRVSLVIEISGAAIITVIGVTYGCINGTAGPKVDSVLMRFTRKCVEVFRHFLWYWSYLLFSRQMMWSAFPLSLVLPDGSHWPVS